MYILAKNIYANRILSCPNQLQVICEGCGIEAELFECDAYECNETHYFCNACCFKPVCPVDGLPPKP